MAWVKIDDQFADHPKAAEAGPLGIAMQVAALCYASRHLTDGFIAGAVAVRLLDLSGLAEEVPDDRDLDDSHVDGYRITWLWVVEKLVAAGLWEAVPGGWQIHDYLDYNPSRAGTLAKRAADLERKRGRRPGATESARNPVGTAAESKCPVPDPVPDPQEYASPPLPPHRGEPPAAAKKQAAARPLAAVPKPKDRPEPADPLRDALVAGIGVVPATSAERAAVAKVVRELRDLGATPREVLKRCSNYVATWPDVPLTPAALLAHWSRMAHAPPPRPTASHHGPSPPSSSARAGASTQISDETLAWLKRKRPVEQGTEA